MSEKITCLRIIIIALLFLAALPATRSQAQGPAPTRSLTFDRLTRTDGWLLLDQILYRTDDAGQSWTDISPARRSDLIIRAVSFPDPQTGRLILTDSNPAAAPTYYLAKTAAGGDTWTLTVLSLFPPDHLQAPIEAIYLQFLDAQTGWLVIKAASGSNFSRGTLFRTTDGGQSWAELPIPSGAPVVFETPKLGWTVGGPDSQARYRTTDGGRTWQALSPDQPFPSGDQRLHLLPDRPPITLPSGDLIAALTAVDLVTSDLGWAAYTAGRCQAGRCRQETGLLNTNDGGRSWQVISLPQPTTVKIAPAANLTPARRPSVPRSGGLIETLTGHGFDKCEVATLSQLQSWQESGPYLAVNLYIGGISRACANSALSAGYVAQLSQQGWRFIPTWVGPQAACTTYTHRMSYDVGEAYNQGVGEALAAVQTAANLGLTLADQSGTVIYYDLERYDLNDVACHDAARAFITGWTTQIQASNNLAGLYGSGPTLAAFAQLEPLLDAIWPAHWIYPTYDPAATVWDVYGLPNELWANQQRLRQYAGDHFETWGGTTLHLDSDVLDGPVAALIPDQIAPTTTLTLTGSLGSNDWYTSDLQITLTVADSGGSRVRAIQYRLDDDPWLVYTSPITLTGDGVYSLTYQSQDNAGNLETPQTSTLKVDATPPTTTLTLTGSLGSNGWYTSDLQITLTVTDSGGSRVRATQYRLDDDAWLVYTAPITLTGDGVYSLTYQSQDNAGNPEAPQTSTLKVDTTPPGGAFSIDGGNQTSSPAIQLSLSAADNLSGVESVQLSNDQAIWTTLPYTTHVEWTIPASDGSWYTVYLRFVDRAGNGSETLSQQICLGATVFFPDGCATVLLPPPRLYLPLVSKQSDFSGLVILPRPR